QLAGRGDEHGIRIERHRAVEPDAGGAGVERDESRRRAAVEHDPAADDGRAADVDRTHRVDERYRTQVARRAIRPADRDATVGPGDGELIQPLRGAEIRVETDRAGAGGEREAVVLAGLAIDRGG